MCVVGRTTILIASPHRTTAYHIDSDVNYLFQVAGDKFFAVFDQTDRTLVTDEELECFFNGDLSAAHFKPDREAEATTYDLKAGFGVHVPWLAPHWARNGGQVSIAVSCNFDLAPLQRLSAIYKTNHRLRSIGLRPRSPRDRSWRDGAKVFGVQNCLRVARASPTAVGKSAHGRGLETVWLIPAQVRFSPSGPTSTYLPRNARAMIRFDPRTSGIPGLTPPEILVCLRIPKTAGSTMESVFDRCLSGQRLPWAHSGGLDLSVADSVD